MAGGVCSAAGRTTLFKSPTLFDAFFLARLLHIVSVVRSLFEKWNKNVYPEFLIGLKKYLTNDEFDLWVRPEQMIGPSVKWLQEIW